MKKILLPLIAVLLAQAPAGDIYHEPLSGFIITKPRSWHFITFDEYLKSMESFKFRDPEQIGRMKTATRPSVIIAKHPEPHPGLNPGLSVYLCECRTDTDPSRTETLVMREMKTLLMRAGEVLFDFRVTDGPGMVRVGGREAGYARISFRIYSQNGAVYDAAGEFRIIPTGMYYLQIESLIPENAGPDIREEMDSIIRSARFSPGK